MPEGATRGLLGVAYYPEHWPRDKWEEDARRMKEMGITYVRIAEFAWSRIEPSRGVFDWEWLDASIEVLGSHGLKVLMCTPTPTPPKWLIDEHPDIIAVDEQGKPRKFGSRRHYDFTNVVYRNETARIVEIVARRYGQNPHVGGWQIDNEFGCHDTAISFSASARVGFQQWLRGSSRGTWGS
eukprot:GILI01046006.1.p1 GENE.GILI01046006.1~~GILI01046006.1.p1  ORF type:complete len:209 (+),score=43.96 GILI01046006.1:83-628(+)